MAELAVVDSSSAPANLYDAKRPVYTTEMSYEDFAAIEDCPRQRNHELRIDKRHLQTYNPAMRLVSVAVLPSGKCYKLDGHTRAYMVSLGMLPELRTGKLIACIYSLPNLKAVKDQYSVFDNPGAAETASERAQGASRELNITFTTPLFQRGGFTGAMSLATKALMSATSGVFMSRNPDKVEQVAVFKDALVEIDALDPNRGRFNQGVLAAAILAFYKHGSAAKDFFDSYNTTTGLECGPKRNPVRMLHEVINRMRKDGKVAGTSANDEQMAYTLALFNRHLSNPAGFWNNLPTPLRPVDFLRA